MKKENVSDIIGHIDDKYVNEAAEYAVSLEHKNAGRRTASPERSAKKLRLIRFAIPAVCAAVLIGIGAAVTAVAVENRAYNEAAAFFEENGLSTEGLSRSEVKNVYRDITTKSFTFGKTAEVLRRAVPGLEIEQDEPSPEELAALWGRNVFMNSQPQPMKMITKTRNGVNYNVDHRYVYDEKRGFEVLDKSILECYRDEKLLWSAEFKDFYIDNFAVFKEGTVIWGGNEIYSTVDDIKYGWIAFADNAGNVKWQRRLDHGFEWEYIASVLSNGDGTLAVIGVGDFKYLCLSCYDVGGNETGFRKTDAGDHLVVGNAARLGDGYIIQLLNHTAGGIAERLCKMDREGVVTDNFSYEADDCDYCITDMAEFEGQIYLSAYAVPKQYDEGGRHEIANILDYAFSNYSPSYAFSEGLTQTVRNNYTAILLICDPEGGAPKTFRSVKGSLGGKLAAREDGILEWDVESVYAAYFSPATSSYSIGGSCKVFRYTFGADGSLIGQKDTGEYVPYRR